MMALRASTLCVTYRSSPQPVTGALHVLPGYLEQSHRRSLAKGARANLTDIQQTRKVFKDLGKSNQQDYDCIAL